MIVVVGSRHDPVAMSLAARWPRAVLCSAEDLVRPGWVWRSGKRAVRQWVVNSQPVRDDEVTGVFVRRSSVYAEELLTTHRDDRVFLAAENHAFLTFVLATTAARVVNPVVDGAFGEEALRPERWIAAAADAGLAIHPLRVRSEPKRRTQFGTRALEVVGDDVFGKAPARIAGATKRAARALAAPWAAFLFDTKYRLLTVTAARPPSDEAAAALQLLLTS